MKIRIIKIGTETCIIDGRLESYQIAIAEPVKERKRK